ncbi:hypothetical protein [Jutongia sp.]|uniref:hypothetical protein n=1 Tax=Jutongia sp. TaxID=2944204 RepID=UPI00307A7809
MLLFTAVTARRPQPAAKPAARVRASHVHWLRLWAVTAYTQLSTEKILHKRAYAGLSSGKLL